MVSRETFNVNKVSGTLYNGLLYGVASACGSIEHWGTRTVEKIQGYQQIRRDTALNGNSDDNFLKVLHSHTQHDILVPDQGPV